MDFFSIKVLSQSFNVILEVIVQVEFDGYDLIVFMLFVYNISYIVGKRFLCYFNVLYFKDLLWKIMVEEVFIFFDCVNIDVIDVKLFQYQLRR